MVIIRWCEECEQRSSRIDVCTNCGLVFEEKQIDYREPRSNRDLSTVVKHEENMKNYCESKTVYTTKGCKNYDLRRALYKYQNECADWGSWYVRRDFIVKEEVKRICNLLGLKTDFYASVIYCYTKIFKNKRKLKTKIRMEIVAQSLVYLQIKMQQLPYSLYDFRRIDCDVGKIKNYYSRLIKKLNLKFEKIGPETFVNRIINGLDLKVRDVSLLTIASQNFIENLETIEKEMTSLTLFRNPIVKAAGCIFSLSKAFNIEKKKFKEIVGCDTRTLSKRFTEIKKVLNDIKIFGFMEDRYKESLQDDEYTKICNEAAISLEVNDRFLNGLINPKFKMKIEKPKFKVVFY